MIKWIWAFFFCTVIFGMWLIFDQGIKPKSVKVLKPSAFPTAEEFGRFTYDNLRPKFALDKVVYIGHQPGLGEHDKFLNGFLDQSQKSDLFYDVLIVQQTQIELRPQPKLQVIDLQPGGPSLEFVLSEELSKNKRVIVYTNSLDVMHFNKSSFVNSARGFTFALVGIPRDRVVDPIEECHSDPKVKYTHTLGCLLAGKEKELALKKNVPWDKFVAAIDQEGERDYVLYTREPTVASP